MFGRPENLTIFRPLLHVFSAVRQPQADSGKMPLAATALPVKKQNSQTRRAGCFAIIKNNITLNIVRAKRRQF